MAGATVRSAQGRYFKGLIKLVLVEPFLQDEREDSIRIGLHVGFSPDFAVPPLDKSSASVSLSVKWGSSNYLSP